MKDRAQMRMNRHGKDAPAAPQSAILPRGARPFGNRVRDVMGQPTTIPVAAAQKPIPRTGIRPTDTTSSALQSSIESLQSSVDKLTLAIRQSSGLDAADQELDELRTANAALQAQVGELLQANAELGAALDLPDPAPGAQEAVEELEGPAA